MNNLYFGDNLDVLATRVADESIDLVYLDPPFNSKISYNVLYKSPVGGDAQERAFKDTWSWEDGASKALDDLSKANVEVFEVLRALQSFLGQSDLMAYLAMMTIRLELLQRKLKQSGSLYLHCDPTASHYLKIILDVIFGAENFRSEIVWKRYGSHNDVKKSYAAVHDTILYYVRSASAPFYKQWLALKSYLDASITRNGAARRPSGLGLNRAVQGGYRICAPPLPGSHWQGLSFASRPLGVSPCTWV